MAEKTFSYTIENDIAFQTAINNAIREVGSLKTPFKLIMHDFYKSERAIFKLKSSGQYPDFKTKRSKRQKIKEVGFAYPLLLRTGKLMRSMTEPNDSNAINIIKDDELVIGTKVSYGVYHQSDRPRKKIPLRKFLFVGPEAPRFATSEQVGRLQRWTKIIKKYVDRKIGSK